MKKLVLTSLALSVGLMAGHAYAVAVPNNGVGPTTGVNWSDAAITSALGATGQTTYITGSSAATPFLEAALRASQCLRSVVGGVQATPLYKYNAGSGATFVYVCEGTTATPGNRILVVQKRDSGGSINAARAALNLPVPGGLPTVHSTQWVSTPVGANTCTLANNGAATAALSPMYNCTGAALTAYVASPRPELALSDVEADKLGIKGTNYSAVASQVFGVVVNLSLRDAMQTAMIAKGLLIKTPATGTAAAVPCTVGDETENCMPNLTTAQVTSIFANGGIDDFGNMALTPGISTPATLPSDYLFTGIPNSTINICGRTFGSGTWATMNMKFENSPCIGTADPLPNEATQVLNRTYATAGNKVFHAMSGSGDVESCLSGLNSGTAVGTFTPNTNQRWAIGVMGVERNVAGTLPYRFIKIDGSAPSNHNVVEGRYRYWAQMGSVTGTAAGLPAVTDPLAVRLLAQMKDPTQIQFMNVYQTWKASATDVRASTGFLGEARNGTNFSVTDGVGPATNGSPNLMNAAYDVTRPVNPYSHERTNADGNPDHCRMPTIRKGLDIMPIFYD
jgi:hypothetical protein